VQRFFLTSTLLLSVAMMSGCATPRHTLSLDRLLIQAGAGHEAHYGYRCTAGAHRGASITCRENTLAALKAAEQDSQYAFIEFDVQYSQDGRIVVFHDKRMLREFGSLRTIGKTEFAKLSDISEGEITTYDEVMEVLTKKLNIEIKSQGDLEQDKRLVDAIVADIRARKRDKDVLMSSISSDVVAYISTRYPTIPTGKVFWLTSSTYLPFDGLTKKLYENMRATDAHYLLLHVSNLHNIRDLLHFKPKDKTIVFWEFDDTIYVVHKDNSDRLWGHSRAGELFRALRYKLSRKKR
jgi:glycerophosphoryl diester phosphodiesterase